jgi:hypothetical protein
VELRHRIAIAVLGFAALIGTAALVAQLFVAPVSTAVDTAGVNAVGGKAFTMDASLKSRWRRLVEVRSDQVPYPRQSNLVVLEDGKPLGPPHAVHVDIDKQGAGRYSHWVASPGGMLIFSASDNSDPRTNGRKYEISARPLPVPLLMGGILLLPIFLFALQRLLFPRRDMTVGLAALVSVTAATAWGLLFFNHVKLAPDSTTYIHWSYLVPLGYSLFLSGVRAVGRTLDWVGTVQVVILVAACFSVGMSVRALLKSGTAALASLLLLLCCIPMFVHADWILSEALFTPLALFNLAAALFLIAQQKARYALLLAVTATLVLFVRPAGYYIVAGIVFLLIAQRDRFYWILRWACVPFVVCIAATILINAGVRGNTASSQLGRVLFPTVAFLFEPQFVTGQHQALAPVIDNALKPHRDVYRSISDRSARIAYLTDDYNARLSAMEDALDVAHRQNRVASFRLRESMFLDFFLTTISHRPVAYVKLVFEQIIEAWATGVLSPYDPFRAKHLMEVDEIPARSEQIRLQGLPMTRGDVRFRTDLVDAVPGRYVEVFEQGYRFIRERRWLIYLVGIVTLIAIPIAVFLRRESRFWLSLGYCGVMIHGSMLLTAAVTVFIPRYAVAVDPGILIAGAIMTVGAIRSAAAIRGAGFGHRLAVLTRRVQ